MAKRIATADGNLTAAGTWGAVDATSLLDSEANNTALTAAYVESATSTPGAITVDGIAVKVFSRAAVASGTMSVRIAQAGALVAGTEVTINVSDLPTRDVGWVFFKFAAPVVLLAATLYTVSAKTSVITQVNLYRDATAGNWSRMLRTTTTGAPAAGDDMYICGEWTAAGTKTDRTVTMNSTAATDYGAASTTLTAFGISKGGTLTWGTTAATNYILRLSGILTVYLGGVMNMGTTGTPCPRDSTQLLEFDCGADGDFGLKAYGTLNTQGLSRTVGKNVVRCLLNTDEAAAQTVLGVDTDTGWLNTDEIGLAATTLTGGTQAETRILNGAAGATTVTVTVGLTFAHSGTSPTQAEMVLLTRNVRIQSVSTTFMAYVLFGVAATVDCDWTSFRYMGSALSEKHGVEILTASGSVALSYCSIRNFDRHGIYASAADWDNLTIDNLTGFGVGHQSANDAAIYLFATTGTNCSLSNVDIVSGGTSQGMGLRTETGKVNLSNIRCNSGHGYGLYVDLGPTVSIDGTWSGFELHSHLLAGAYVRDLTSGKISNVNSWRNAFVGNAGLQFDECFGTLIIEGGSIFGNSVANIFWSTTGFAKRGYVFRNLVIAGDTSNAVAKGALFAANNQTIGATFENCTFGVVSGIFTAHTGADIDFTANDRYAEITLIHTLLASATEFLNKASLRGRSFIAYERVDQVTAVHKREYTALGTASYDSVLFRTAAPSEKLEPSGATAGQKLESGVKRVPVLSGGTVSISAYVQKNGAYTGNAPRLMLRANPALGVTADTVIATFSAAALAWQQLSGTTAVATEDGVFEFFIDSDGSAGQINIDDWTAS